MSSRTSDGPWSFPNANPYQQAQIPYDVLVRFRALATPKRAIDLRCRGTIGGDITSEQNRRVTVIAIDGPAASGKSAVGGVAAARLRYRFFDTGAMYRALTWLALERAIDVEDAVALAQLAETAAIDVRVAPTDDPGGTSVIVDGVDATPYLRTPSVEAYVSLVSRVPGVRAALVRIQRELAAGGGVVMAGRDIGTVVLPEAGLKIYLDASRDVRAERRAAQLRASGIEPDIDVLLADLVRRDGIDSSREASPLTAAADAVIIKTDEMNVDAVVEQILELAG